MQTFPQYTSLEPEKEDPESGDIVEKKYYSQSAFFSETENLYIHNQIENLDISALLLFELLL